MCKRGSSSPKEVFFPIEKRKIKVGREWEKTPRNPFTYKVGTSKELFGLLSFIVNQSQSYLEKNRRLAYFLDSLNGKYAVPTKEEREAFIATVPVYGERLQTLQRVKRTGG
jgi:hypothetical protein